MASQCDPMETLDTVLETLDEVALLVKGPVDRMPSAACRVLSCLRGRAQIIGDECAQAIGILGGILDLSCDLDELARH